MAKKSWKLIGEVGVDSGQLIICDPCYLSSQWTAREAGIEDLGTASIYRDNDGREYGCAFHHGSRPYTHMFKGYEDVLPNGKTPNQMTKEKLWEEIPAARENRHEFSYRGCCQATDDDTLGGGQLNYKKGHAGAGVVAGTAYGDGCYPVYGLYEEGSSRPLAMLVLTDDVKTLPKLPDND